MLILLILGCPPKTLPSTAAADSPSLSTLTEQLRTAGYHPAPGLSSSIIPGTLVWKGDGAVFLGREDCFPDAALSSGAFAVAGVATALQAGLRASVGDALGLIGSVSSDKSIGREVELSVDSPTVEGVAVGTLTPSESCLATLNRQQQAGVSLDSYLLITEVVRAETVTVRDRSNHMVDVEGKLSIEVVSVGVGASVEKVTESGFTIRGPVTLGYKCRQLVGLHDDGGTSNAGEAVSCPGFGR